MEFTPSPDLLEREQAGKAAAPSFGFTPSSDLLDAEMRQQNSEDAMLGAFARAHATNPDEFARLKQKAVQAGLTPEQIEQFPAEAERRARFDEAQRIARNSPTLAKWLAVPGNAEIAKDDTENMGAIESALRSIGQFGRSVASGVQQAPADLVYGGGRAVMDVLSPLGKPVFEPLLGFNPYEKGAALFADQQRNAAAMGKAIQGDTSKLGFIGQAVNKGAKSLGGNLVTLPMGVYRGANAALALMVGSEFGRSYGEARGKGVDTTRALTYAASQAAVEYATEKLPMKWLLGDLKAGSSFMKTLGKQALAEIPGEQLATVVQDMNEWAVLNPDKPFKAYLEERPSAAAQTLIATVVGTGGNVAVLKTAEMLANAAGGKAARAEQDANALAKIAELAKASKVAQRDPESFQQWIDDAAEDGPVQTVYVDAKMLMQGGLAAQIVADSPAVAAQLDDAYLTGGQVAIPIGEFATRIAPKEYAQSLLPHLKTDPDGFSQVEAQAYMQSHAEEFQSEVEKALAEQGADEEFKASAEVVKGEIKAQLDTAARFTPQVNDAYAALVGNWYAVTAAKIGTTPEALYQRYPLTVTAEHIDSLQFDQGEVSAEKPDGSAVLNQGLDTAKQVIEQARVEGYEGNNRGEAAEWVAAKARGLDMSTDARMERAKAMGFDTSKVYFHSSLEDVKAFQPTGRLMGYTGTTGISVTDNPEMASRYLDRFGNFRWDGKAFDKNVIPVFIRPGKVLERNEPFKTDLPFGAPLPEGYVPAHKLMGYDTLMRDDAVSRKGAVKHSDAKNAIRGKELVLTDPSQVRSIFAAFDHDHASSGDLLAQDARGAFNPATLNIALLKNADLSTFLHETGHFFLEMQFDLAAQLQKESELFGLDTLKPGERQILDDANALLRWFGIRDLNEWHALDFEEKRHHHEQFARGFEAYMFEGKAPSIELQGLFQRFRAWLVNIYRNLKALNVELTDEVRGVMDRMIATNEQIALAERGRSMMPLFESPEQGGMTPEEFAAYHAQGVDATNEAIQDLQGRGLRDLQWLRNARGRVLKKLQADAKAMRGDIEAEARTEIMSQPVYRAWAFLTRKLGDGDKLEPVDRPKSDPEQVTPEVDSLFAAIAKLGGINKTQAVTEWGIDPKDKPQSGVFGKPVWRTEDGGVLLDTMLELLAEHGYMALDANGKADLREFEEKFGEELRGNPQYSIARLPEADAIAGDNVANPEGLDAGRLDRFALSEMNLPDEVVNVLKANRMTAQDGLHPDTVAELFGFSSGDELARALATAEPPKEAIEALTDQRMLERHGELSSSEAISRAADQAIHNDARARLLATEEAALLKAVGTTEQTGTDKNGRPVRRPILPRIAREFAGQLIARLKVRDIRPGQYANAEARAAKASAKAKTAGDIAQAAAEKRNQILNLYATKAAYAAQDEVDAGLRYLRKFDREGTRKALDVDYLDQIDRMLERFDLRATSNKAIDKRAALAKWIESQENAGIEPDIPDWLRDEANRVSYKNLTMEEFRGLVDSIKQIEHLARLKKRLLNQRDQRELDAIVGEMAASIEANAGGRVMDNEERNTLASRLGMVGRWILAAHRKMASIAREMDGFRDAGPVWEHLIRPMNEAGEREASMRAEATRTLYELAKPILAGERMGGKGKHYTALGRALNRGERIALALNWGNEGNRQRLLGGRGWTAGSVAPVLSDVTAEEWAFVQGVWDFFESYRPEIAAKERRVYGKEPDWVEPSAFRVTTADGQTVEMRGGYYPIKYDPKQSGRAGEHADAEDAKAMTRAAYTAATTRRSFTKSRSEEVTGRPLLLSFDGIYQGANEVIHDLAWHEWLIDTNRLMRRLDGAMRTGYGAEAVDALKAGIKDIAVGDKPASNRLESVFNHLRAGSTIVGLGWNLTTAMLQPLGLTQSMVRIGPAWVARGMGRFYGNPARMLAVADEVQGKSEFMRNRARTMQREINELQNQLTEGKGRIRTATEATFFILIQKLQAGVDYPTWLGAYEKAIAYGHPEDRAVASADQAVIDAQGGGQIKDLSQVQRGTPFWKILTNFYSFFNVALNLGVERTRATNFKNPIQVARLAGDYLLLYSLPAVMGAMLKDALKGGDDDEDELIDKLIAEQISFVMGLFVGLREATGAVQMATGVGNPAFGYAGPAGLRFVQELDKLGRQIEQGEADMALFKAANNTAGILFHYPAGQVNRTVEGTIALLDERTSNPLAPLVGPPPR